MPSRPHPVRVGAVLWPEVESWPRLAEAARSADRAGVDSLWTWDHLHAIAGEPMSPIFEGWMVLAGFATVTSSASVGLLVGANTFRNPALVAKLAVTLDHLSNGRTILGMGAAWFHEEHLANGVPFGASPGERLDWLEEAVTAIEILLSGGSVTSDPNGRYRFERLRQAPPPVRGPGTIPLMIGGSGERKTLRTVARHANAWNTSGSLEHLRHLLGVLRRHCDEAGRDPATIELTVNHNICIRDTVEDARSAWAHTIEASGEAYTPDDDWDWFGPPEAIAERWRPLLDLGFRHAITEVPAPYDLETLVRLREVRDLVS